MNLFLVSLFICVNLAQPSQAFFFFDYDNVLDQIKSEAKLVNTFVAVASEMSRLELFNQSDYYRRTLASNFTTELGERYNYGGCACQMVSCFCCAKLEIAARDTVCSSFTFNVTSLQMKVKFDLEPTFNETFTEVFDARMPANSCHEIINNQTFCNNFYGMAVSHDANMVNGCLEVSVRDSNSTTLANMRVGCFSMFYAVSFLNSVFNLKKKFRDFLNKLFFFKL